MLSYVADIAFLKASSGVWGRYEVKRGIIIREKRSQIVSIDAVIAVGVFLVLIIIFFGVIAARTSKTGIEDEAKEITDNAMSYTVFEDKNLDFTEEIFFSEMDCTQLKELLDTKGKEVCIYFETDEGDVVPLSQNTKFGIGCPGINISGVPCGSTFYGEWTFKEGPFVIENSADRAVAIFSYSGDVILKGNCTAMADCIAPPDSALVIRNAMDEQVSYIDSDGNMCLEDMILGCHKGSPDPDCSSFVEGSLVIIDSDENVVAYMSPNGGLCYTNSLNVYSKI